MDDETQYSTRRWQAQPDDAIKLAALRWFALRIESEAIQIYATDFRRYEAIEEIMRACVAQIHGLAKTVALVDDSDCPPGYVKCRDECAPMCDGLE